MSLYASQQIIFMRAQKRKKNVKFFPSLTALISVF